MNDIERIIAAAHRAAASNQDEKNIVAAFMAEVADSFTAPEFDANNLLERPCS